MSLNTLLIVAPHVDDAELSCGGLIARSSREGHRVVVVNLSASDYKSKISGKTVQRARRYAEGLQAASLLGIDEHDYIFGDFAKENEFSFEQIGKMVTGLQDIIAKVGANEVYVPAPTFNQDHEIAFKACMAALRPHGTIQQPDLICAYEQPTQFWSGMEDTKGRVFVSIQPNDMNIKIEALKCHTSQAVSKADGPFGYTAVKNLANLRGSQAGVPLAEMFYLLRQVVK